MGARCTEGCIQPPNAAEMLVSVLSHFRPGLRRKFRVRGVIRDTGYSNAKLSSVTG